MNTLPLHPAVVHVPLGLSLIMPVLLAGLVWAIVAGRLPPRAWLVGLLLQGVVLGAAALALWSGEQDEERVERSAVEAQVEAQTFGPGLHLRGRWNVRRRCRWPRPAEPATTLPHGGSRNRGPSLAMLGLGIQAGHRGGLLVHGGSGLGAPVRGEPGGGEEQAVSRDARDQDDDGDDD